jgi:hypothetical protein
MPCIIVLHCPIMPLMSPDMPIMFIMSDITPPIIPIIPRWPIIVEPRGMLR